MICRPALNPLSHTSQGSLHVRYTFMLDILLVLEKLQSPGWWGPVGGASSHKPKGQWFNSQTVHMPGLQVQSPFGVPKEGN